MKQPRLLVAHRSMFSICLIAIACSATSSIVQFAAYAQEAKKGTTLHGHITASEEQAKDTLSGFVKHDAAAMKLSDVLSGSVESGKNPYNSFPVHSNLVAGKVVEPLPQYYPTSTPSRGIGLFGVGTPYKQHHGSVFTKKHVHDHAPVKTSPQATTPVYTKKPVHTHHGHVHTGTYGSAGTRTIRTPIGVKRNAAGVKRGNVVRIRQSAQSIKQAGRKHKKK